MSVIVTVQMRADPDQFEALRGNDRQEMQSEILPRFEAAGMTGSPQPTFWRKLERTTT